ncbi:MAG: GCN5-related N-acetyltransferase [Lacunisphaera sp.]|nr:GCN5-related N-acetyltransferase [Lacunisphaera sp.]
MNFSGPLPVLETARLRLRPYARADAADLQRLAGHPAVAATTQNIPHPYPDGAAEKWIATHPARWLAHEGLVFACTLKDTGELLGSIGLVIEEAHEKAELGYWVGVRHWNRGYTTEAARAVVGFGFETLGLNRIQSRHFANNPASGRVMEKAGLRREGVSAGAIRKGGVFHDLVFYGLLRADWRPGGGVDSLQNRLA